MLFVTGLLTFTFTFTFFSFSFRCQDLTVVPEQFSSAPPHSLGLNLLFAVVGGMLCKSDRLYIIIDDDDDRPKPRT